jgi:hypothetical protein
MLSVRQLRAMKWDRGKPLTLRRFTSCTRHEDQAIPFLRRATPTSELGRVLFRVKVPAGTKLTNLEAGAGVDIRRMQHGHTTEAEVLLIDGTELQITGAAFDTDAPFTPDEEPLPFRFVRLDCVVKTEATLQYFRFFDDILRQGG